MIKASSKEQFKKRKHQRNLNSDILTDLNHNVWLSWEKHFGIWSSHYNVKLKAQKLENYLSKRSKIKVLLSGILYMGGKQNNFQ